MRRENEQLRREIWSLRDEYDRLDKLLRHNKGGGGGHSSGGGGAEGEGAGAGDDAEGYDDEEECCSCSQDEDEDEEEDGEGESGEEESCDDENCDCREKKKDGGALDNDTNQKLAKLNGGLVPSTSSNNAKLRENLHVNFDHLSIVSEETLTGSDGGGSNSATERKETMTMTSGTSQYGKELISLPATPCSPYLNDFQSLVPPLTHFENINYDDILAPPSIIRSKALPSSSSPSSSSVQLLSPASSSALISPPSSTSNLVTVQQQIESEALASSSSWNWTSPPTVSFSTFRSPNHQSQTDVRPLANNRLHQEVSEGHKGEIVKINSTPKHFFSPIKNLPSSPDVYVHDVLASDSHHHDHHPVDSFKHLEPIYSVIHKPPSSVSPLNTVPSCLLPHAGQQNSRTFSSSVQSPPLHVGINAATTTHKNCQNPTAFQVSGELC